MIVSIMLLLPIYPSCSKIELRHSVTTQTTPVCSNVLYKTSLFGQCSFEAKYSVFSAFSSSINYFSFISQLGPSVDLL